MELGNQQQGLDAKLISEIKKIKANLNLDSGTHPDFPVRMDVSNPGQLEDALEGLPLLSVAVYRNGKVGLVISSSNLFLQGPCIHVCLEDGNEILYLKYGINNMHNYRPLYFLTKEPKTKTDCP